MEPGAQALRDALGAKAAAGRHALDQPARIERVEQRVSRSGDSIGIMRPARMRSSAGVCGPRIISSASTASCAISTFNVDVPVWQYLSTRLLPGNTLRASSLSIRPSSASLASSSDSASTGSRLLFWLAPLTAALSVSGYCSGVVSAFSTSTPSTRAS